jgi:putative thioredoxin
MFEKAVADAHASSHVFDVTVAGFETDVLQKSVEVPVLVDFWAPWCGPCKTLGPILEKLAAEYNGAFRLAKVDVDKEQELAGAFQIRSIPTVILVKNGQPVDGFPGALPESQLRVFLKQHGIEPAPMSDPVEEIAPEAGAIDPHAEVIRLRAASAAATEQDAPRIKLDLAIALLKTGAAHEAEKLIDALPANLATDDRAIRAHAHLRFIALLKDAPPIAVLEAAIAADPGDLHARYLLGAQRLIGGDAAGGLDQFIEMLRRDRGFAEGLPKRSLIDAFRMIEDPDLVSAYRRKMSSLLF